MIKGYSSISMNVEQRRAIEDERQNISATWYEMTPSALSRPVIMATHRT